MAESALEFTGARLSRRRELIRSAPFVIVVVVLGFVAITGFRLPGHASDGELAVYALRVSVLAIVTGLAALASQELSRRLDRHVARALPTRAMRLETLTPSEALGALGWLGVAALVGTHLTILVWMIACREHSAFIAAYSLGLCACVVAGVLGTMRACRRLVVAFDRDSLGIDERLRVREARGAWGSVPVLSLLLQPMSTQLYAAHEALATAMLIAPALAMGCVLLITRRQRSAYRVGAGSRARVPAT